MSSTAVDMAAQLPLCDDDTVGTDAAVEPSLANVQRVFDESCVGCHCCDAYLQLFQGVSYQNLVGRPASADDQNVDESCGGTLVVPGDAGVSYLYQKISSQPCAGAQMPHAEIVFIPLPVCEQDLDTALDLRRSATSMSRPLSVRRAPTRRHAASAASARGACRECRPPLVAATPPDIRGPWALASPSS